MSEYDGVSAYTSKKYTLTVMRDILYTMEAEDKITFNSSGTNKVFMQDSVGTQKILSETSGTYTGYTDQIGISADGTNVFAKGFCIVYNEGASIGYDWDTPTSILELSATSFGLSYNANVLLQGTASGINMGGGQPIVLNTESKITFDDSGTNKQFVTNGTSGIQMEGDIIDISADGATLAKGYITAENTLASIAFNTNGLMEVTSTNARIVFNGTNRIEADGTGLGFFAATPVAKPTVTGAKGGNAALTSLLTQLASLGLITDSTT